MTTTRKQRSTRLLLLAAVVLAASAFPSQAETVSVGKFCYRTDLPPDSQGNPRRLVKVRPRVSGRIQGAVPTNDWWSSLVWPSNSQHSLPMFPHPLAVQAHAEGLGLGYTPNPSISHSYRDGKMFQAGTSYKYPYRESLLVGLVGMESEDCVLDRYSDWSVTSLWKTGSDELRATFAHGSPFVFFEHNSNRPMRIEFTAAAINRNDEPLDALVYELKGITGKHTAAAGEIQLVLNAGENVGIGSKARLSYDFNGDGETDRVETFAMFATDPVPGSWETYSSDKQALDERLTRGDMQDFRNGSVKLEFWKCFGRGSLELRHAESHVVPPVDDGTWFLSDSGGLAESPEDSIGKLAGADEQPTAGRVFYREANVLGVTVNETYYGIFAPTGSTWSPVGDAADGVTSDLNGKGYLSIAVLPDRKPATIQWFQQYAYAFVTDTRIEYHYDRNRAAVTTTYTATTEAKEGQTTETAFALYRHQYLHLTEPERLSSYCYASPRGEMKVVSGQAFETLTPYLGVLPALPNAAGAGETLSAMVDAFYEQVMSRSDTFERDDTYWNGKELGKFSEVIQIADQLGKTDIRDRLVRLLERRMEDWADGREKLFFYYDETWSALIGYPDSYGSADQLNDHHFHYSYFIKAAATIAQYDPDWVRPENYGGLIDLLIRNCANYDRDDRRFPWMRNFDPYAGHSWASGHAGFASGNNQESSSESMNFATALILYGEATQDDTIRDLGIYWHATEAAAICQYWFDMDRVVFPEGYGHSCVGMVWGDGGSYGTWWTANPEEIHGINFLPLNGGSLHLGRDPKYVIRNFQDMLASNRSFHEAGFDGDAEKIDRWHDVLREYLALADPQEAMDRYDELGREQPSEFGETKVHTEQWLLALGSLGQFDATIRADHPTAAVFVKRGVRTYVICNSRSEARKVTFSDGVEYDVPPGLHAFSN